MTRSKEELICEIEEARKKLDKALKKMTGMKRSA